MSFIISRVNFYVAFLIFVSYYINASSSYNIFSSERLFNKLDNKYGSFPEKLRLQMLEKAKEMFYYGYDNYMNHAFPMDELNPIKCSGRGRDHDNPNNININDVLGNYSLTLVDSLDTLAVLGNVTEFQRAVKLVIDYVDFDKDSTVQVFEVNIRLLGALLSAHLLIMDPIEPFGPLKPDWYDGQLLQLAHDLASRLLPAFQESTTGIPYPRVNLRHGLPTQPLLTETCPAGAGSLLLEMGLLSRLLGDPVYEGYARRAIRALWNRRAQPTGLLGNAIDAQSGKWTGKLSGLGAGLDSFYEYLFKTYIMFGETKDYAMFLSSYRSINRYMRRGRPHCNCGEGHHPLFVNVDMDTGAVHTTWIDSLQAAFAGTQVLHGDIEEAICSHALYYLLWKKHGVLPERWDWRSLTPNVSFYPLRPELIEATYLLYKATRSPFYLHVGKDILQSLNTYTKTECGYATVHNVKDMSLEDRMESFFLSETCKYLFLLFDKDNYINQHFSKFVFSTEGHIFTVNSKFREMKEEYAFDTIFLPLAIFNISEPVCDKIDIERTLFLPLKSRYFTQIGETLGLEEY